MHRDKRDSVHALSRDQFDRYDSGRWRSVILAAYFEDDPCLQTRIGRPPMSQR